MRIQNLKNYAFILILSTIITGCMPPNIKYIKNNYNPKKNAIALVGMNHSSELRNVKLVLSNTNNGERKVITSDAEPVLLTPGNWIIKRINFDYSYSDANYIYTEFNAFEASALYPRFKINPGEVKYLGTLWLNRINRFRSNDRIMTLEVKDNFDEEKAAFDHAFPEHFGKLKKDLMKHSNLAEQANKLNKTRGIIYKYEPDRWYTYPINLEPLK